MARFCVFTGSAEGASPAYKAAAETLGRTLAGQGHGVVYGGARVGLMGALATAALDAGGEVIGVLPDFMRARELAHPRLTELLPVRTMHERKALMAELAHGFIALPGGFGTLDELFEILTWAQLGLHDKPIGLLNVAGYFDPLLAFADRATQEGFVRPPHRALLRVHADPERLVADLEGFHPGPSATKWA